MGYTERNLRVLTQLSSLMLFHDAQGGTTIINFGPRSTAEYLGNQNGGMSYFFEKVLTADHGNFVSRSAIAVHTRGRFGLSYTAFGGFFGAGNSNGVGGSDFPVTPGEENDDLVSGFLTILGDDVTIRMRLSVTEPTDLVTFQAMGNRSDGTRRAEFSNLPGGRPNFLTTGLTEEELDSGAGFDTVFSGVTGATSYTFDVSAAPGSTDGLFNLAALRVIVTPIPEPSSSLLSLLSLGTLIFRRRRHSL